MKKYFVQHAYDRTGMGFKLEGEDLEAVKVEAEKQIGLRLVWWKPYIKPTPVKYSIFELPCMTVPAYTGEIMIGDLKV